MKALRFLILVLFLGGFLSCVKKNYPEPTIVENSAIFYSKLTIDNKPFELNAGVDGYYMYSSYKRDSNFVYGFIADLKKSDCSNCANSLKIQINDYKVSLSNAASFVDSSLHKGTYSFAAGNPVASYAMQFNATGNTAISYLWDFGDGTTSTLKNPLKVFSSAGKYHVCLTTKKANNCLSSICNIEKIDASPNSCKTSVIATAASGNTVKFSSVTNGGKAPYQYLWNFGNGTTSNKNDDSCAYLYRGSYPVTLRVIDSYGDTAYANYNAKTANDISSCAANYSKLPISEIAAEPGLSKIIVTWVDEAGVIYTSNNLLQPNSSSFEIISVNENEKNEKQQLTKKITAKFNCKLYSGNKSVTVNNAEVVICVAYQ